MSEVPLYIQCIPYIQTKPWGVRVRTLDGPASGDDFRHPCRVRTHRGKNTPAPTLNPSSSAEATHFRHDGGQAKVNSIAESRKSLDSATN